MRQFGFKVMVQHVTTKIDSLTKQTSYNVRYNT